MDEWSHCQRDDKRAPSHSAPMQPADRYDYQLDSCSDHPNGSSTYAYRASHESIARAGTKTRAQIHSIEKRQSK
jgi:hypothetical protein